MPSIVRSYASIRKSAGKSASTAISDSYDLRFTIAHEIGHAIGLDHPGATGQMMAFKYDEHFRQLQSGDIDGVTTHLRPPCGTRSRFG